MTPSPRIIPWERFEANGRRLAANDRGPGSKKATGRAPTLLNGIVRCGRCGRPMGARNARASANPRYACDWEFREYGGPRCQSLVAAYPDRLIESLVLKAVEPASLELSLRTAERVEQDRGRPAWALEAAAGAVRVRRRTGRGGSTTRSIRRTGWWPGSWSGQWEQKLAERRRLMEDHDRFQAEQPRHLSAPDRARITALAADLPGLWRSPTTTGGDRRAVVRLLIERVELTRDGESERVEVVIHWRGGAVTRHEIRQGLRTYRSLGGLARLRGRILELRGDGWTADAIAEALNREGYQAARGAGFTGDRVRQLLARFGRSGVPAGVRGADDLPGTGEWWLPALAAELGVKPIVVHRWRWSGWLHTRQLRGENGRWIVWADAAEVGRLRRLREFEIEHHGRRDAPVRPEQPAESTRRAGPDYVLAEWR